MANFFIDSDELGYADLKKFESALAPLAESDSTLFVEVAFVSEEEIRALNLEHRSIDKVTDVLSFPAMDAIKGKPLVAAEHPFELDEQGRLFLGSVAVCEERAKEQAAQFGHSYERELYYLITHGILHCLGYDHEEEQDKEEMRAREEEVMQKLKLTRENS